MKSDTNVIKSILSFLLLCEDDFLDVCVTVEDAILSELLFVNVSDFFEVVNNLGRMCRTFVYSYLDNFSLFKCTFVNADCVTNCTKL